MAEHWIKYVRRYDALLEDALRLAIKSTMQNMYKLVHGDGKRPNFITLCNMQCNTQEGFSIYKLSFYPKNVKGCYEKNNSA